MNTKEILQKVKANLEKKSSAYQDYMKKFMKDKGVNMKTMDKKLWKELGDGWKSKAEKESSLKESSMGDSKTIRDGIKKLEEDVDALYPSGKGEIIEFIKDSDEVPKDLKEELLSEFKNFGDALGKAHTIAENLVDMVKSK